jgi:hypothetical protein
LDAEVITLAVAQALMNITHDADFLAAATHRLRHLFPRLPKQPGYWKRRQRLSDTVEARRSWSGRRGRGKLLSSTIAAVTGQRFLIST